MEAIAIKVKSCCRLIFEKNISDNVEQNKGKFRLDYNSGGKVKMITTFLSHSIID